MSIQGQVHDLILQDQASGERSQDQWSSGFRLCEPFYTGTMGLIHCMPAVTNFDIDSFIMHIINYNHGLLKVIYSRQLLV